MTCYRTPGVIYTREGPRKFNAYKLPHERLAQAMSARRAKTPKAVEGDSPPARSEGCAQTLSGDHP